MNSYVNYYDYASQNKVGIQVARSKMHSEPQSDSVRLVTILNSSTVSATPKQMLKTILEILSMGFGLETTLASNESNPAIARGFVQLRDGIGFDKISKRLEELGSGEDIEWSLQTIEDEL